MNLNELWKLYKSDKQIQGFSPHTLKAYSLQLNVLIREIGNLELDEVSLSVLKEYLAKQSERLKASSLGHRIRFVRSLFRYAFEEGYVSPNPALKLKESKFDKRIPKFLIEEDVIHLEISCQSLRDHTLLQFLYSTGCRVGEVHRLNVEDINWENGSAIVNGKGSKQREVYFTTECKVWLKKYLDSREDNCEAEDPYPPLRCQVDCSSWKDFCKCLSSPFSTHIIEEFIGTVSDEESREALYEAIQGRGAFRRFKDGIIEQRVEKEWYEYKDKKIKELVIEWCKEHDIVVEE